MAIEIPIMEGAILYPNDISGDYIIELRVSNQYQHSANTLAKLFNSEKPLEVIVRKEQKDKSEKSLKYMWVALSQISELTGIPKDDVYKEMIRKYGFSETYPVKTEDVNWKISNHTAEGHLGNQVDIIGPSRQFPGYTVLKFYYGTSNYDQEKLNKLLNGISDELDALQRDA